MVWVESQRCIYKDAAARTVSSGHLQPSMDTAQVSLKLGELFPVKDSQFSGLEKLEDHLTAICAGLQVSDGAGGWDGHPVGTGNEATSDNQKHRNT